MVSATARLEKTFSHGGAKINYERSSHEVEQSVPLKCPNAFGLRVIGVELLNCKV